MNQTIRLRRGIALLWVALFFVLFLAFLGLVLDTAWVALVSHQLQNAADASALAGAPHIRNNQSQARLSAQELAYANIGGTDGGGYIPVQVNLNDVNAANGDIVLGRYFFGDQSFVPNTTNPNAIKVNARRTDGSIDGSQPLFFGPVFGADAAQAQRSAIAVVAGGLGAGLLVLDPRGNGPGNDALHLQGGPDLAVINGTIQVNSASNTAVRMQGSYTVVGEEMNIVGRMSNPPSSIPVNFNMPVIPDPLSWLAEPDPTGMTPIIDDGVQTNFTPGYYPLGINVGTRHITFASGTYILGTSTTIGNIFVMNPSDNNASITADGCTFFILGGSLRWTGGACFVRPPPLEAGHYYEHVSIFQARNNASTMEINGNPGFDISGTVYLPGQLDGSNGPLFDLNGTFGGSGGGVGEGVQVIAYRVRLGGTANMYLEFDGWWPWPTPKTVYLVQ